jgi:50S ribosomal protein L16 3-hydroxylase
LKSWPQAVQAHLPDVRDESSSIDTNTKDAQKLFNNGMGLLFNEAQNISPLLVEWLEEIKKDKGLSQITYARSLIYATPDGKGTAPHFDQNINFVYQVHGTKVWNMARNTDLVNPLTRHTMGTMPDPEMMGYLEAPLPTSMPKDVETYELRPGSVLFVPRGHWHSTEAEGDALALNFTFTAPTWLDLFTAALRSRLAMSPEWRETANGVNDSDYRHLAEKKFDLLLSSLVDDLPHWRAADILDAIEPLEP